MDCIGYTCQVVSPFRLGSLDCNWLFLLALTKLNLTISDTNGTQTTLDLMLPVEMLKTHHVYALVFTIQLSTHVQLLCYFNFHFPQFQSCLKKYHYYAAKI